ncbi:MAG: ABC transporter permease [Nitrososphaerota archaeon]|jgi:ABC-2 type transport system permease protein|nr:ABC transporter permease [Nitrososphaerota archaeon]MDG6927917.1 ABC transporter permease [Nitrososphaerota archaeon]MDG6930118.1 ABC transporter permease [Nitrososphaerota archaeon]MDG6932561.1 ABC transporter permease [Nitrososphaerota archaeon]MDG6935287.1 ABC transporter permease [Nitrososphaerota archaeon]
MQKGSFYHLYIVMKKDLTEFYRVRARLVSMIMLPILLMLLFGYMFPSSGSITHIPIAIVNQDQSATAIQVINSFTYMAQSGNAFNVLTYTSLAQAQQALLQGKIYAIVIFRPGFGEGLKSGAAAVQVIVDQMNPTLDQVVTGGIQSIFSQLNVQLSLSQGFPAQAGTISVNFQGLIPGSPSSFEFLAPGFIAMSMVMGGLAGLAMTFSRERELGTLDGMLMTPISRFSIVMGKAMAQAVRGIISGVMIVILAIILFGVKIYGNIFLMSLIIFLGILSFTGLGLIATSFVSDQESAQMIMLMIEMPMIFISGIFYPVLQLPLWLRDIAYMLPLSYTVSAFRSVMVMNAPLSAVWPDVLVLIVYSLVTFAIAIPLFQKMVTK